MGSTNILSLDVGERRIGVALAGVEARIASPLLTLDRQDHSDIYVRIKQLIDQYNVQVVVVGLPRGMEGQETGQTGVARAFASELAEKCKVTVRMQDEAATSLAAEDELKATGKPYQKGDIDAHAAKIILRDWLENPESEDV